MLKLTRLAETPKMSISKTADNRIAIGLGRKHETCAMFMPGKEKNGKKSIQELENMMHQYDLSPEEKMLVYLSIGK